MTGKIYKFVEFVNEALIPDIEGMIERGYQYYAFSIICQAIEVLGSFYDTYPLEKRKESQNRFTRILKKFKNPKYKNKQTLFFTALRGNMIHQLRPGKSFLLSSSKHNKTPEDQHLENYSGGQTILVIECFFEDFKKAFERFKNDCEKNNGKIDKKKLEIDFLKIIPMKKISLDTLITSPESSGISTETEVLSGGG